MHERNLSGTDGGGRRSRQKKSEAVSSRNRLASFVNDDDVGSSCSTCTTFFDACCCFNGFFADCRGAADVQLQYGILVNSEILDDYVTNNSDKPVVIIDLDGTVVSGSTLSILAMVVGSFFPFLYTTFVGPMPLAPEKITEFSASYNIVYVTARPRQVGAPSLDWLNSKGFPEAPLFYQDRSIFSFIETLIQPDFVVEYKTEAVQYVSDQGLTVEWGIGDSPTDIKAYSNNELKSILILENFGDSDLGDTLAILGLNIVTLLDPSVFEGLSYITVGNDDAWTNINEYITTT